MAPDLYELAKMTSAPSAAAPLCMAEMYTAVRAGWFEGNRVVLVYRQTKTPDLAALAFGVKSTPLNG
jgi:hypothetical protein